jgi:NADPH:quinone reductase-like Zn-dependent oxidoreductase
MDAVVIQASGPPAKSLATPAGALATTQAPLPAVAPGESLAEVRAAGINPAMNEPIGRKQS